MKQLLFDLRMVQPLGGSKYHGGGRYGEIVFHKLISMSNKVVGVYDSSSWLNPDIIEAARKNNIQLVDVRETTIKKILDSGDFVLYSPIGMNEHRLLSQNYKVIATIHGLRMYEMPGDSTELKYTFPTNLKDWMWTIGGMMFPSAIIKWARHRAIQNFVGSKMHIITVSNHSKYSIMSAVPSIKDDDISVFYSPSTVDSTLNTISLDYGKYYLMVSGNRWLKNDYRAVQAFEELFDERPDLDFKVVITGISENVRYAKKIRHKDRFIFLQYVDNTMLNSLYANAYAFVYPTLNEGFGYPPIEAMSHGTPVISSAIASVTEVCSDAILYFNPYSVREMKMRILQMENCSFYESFVKKSKNRYQEIFSKQNKDLEDFVNLLLSNL